MKRVIALILLFLLLFTSCGFKNVNPDTEEPLPKNHGRVIATWIYYNEIEKLVNSSATEADFIKKIENVIDSLVGFSVNTVILHARAFDDAFYKSELFPVSRYCDDGGGKLKLDVLKCFTEVCHSKGVELWAWVNPYRINKVDDVTVVKEGTFASNALSSDNSQIIIHSQNGVYYNPADLSVKKHIIDGIREILENYDVDGIHFDDYFYPRADKGIDSAYYSEYKANGGELSLSDFRRENVNSLIYSVCALVRKYDKVFSISPMSNIEGNINGCYADVRLWASSDSYVDYIIPQIYFGFENEVSPFEKTLKAWFALTGDSEKLIIGLGVYKSGKTDVYAKGGRDEWKSREVISKEIDYILKNYDNVGFSYYSASFLYEPSDDGVLTENANIKSALNAYLPSSVT